MNMNLPNKLTMLRVFMIPVFVILFILGEMYGVRLLNEPESFSLNIYRLLSALVFVIASITDYFDGKIARAQNLVTNFGKLMDPLADKMLVVTALILLSHTKEVHYICTLLVVLRELTISSIRLIALEQGIVIAASYWGKIKTATQMVAVVLILFDVYKINNILYYVTYGMFYISTAFVAISLVDYIIKSKKVFNS